MNLLNLIFPELGNWSQEGIPEWIGAEDPWSILGESEMSLKSQILRLVRGSDEVFIHHTAEIGDYVVIEGPSFVGPNTKIRNGALLRSGSWICDGAIVGHCSEVKNSILLPKSKVPHFNYVGDSIIGIGANLGAGVKISNVRNDRRRVLVSMEDGSKIESGLSKLGAMVGDGSQLGCNVVTNPGTIISPGSMIAPNKTINGWF